MNRYGKLAFALLLATISIRAFAGCSSMKIEDFSSTTPVFRVEEYFAGETKGYGMFVDRFGRVKRQFVVDMIGTVQGNELVLKETFKYSDGEKDARTWTIVKKDEHSYEGRAADVIGTARGKAYGQALRWDYYLDLKVSGSTMKVHMDDWMFLQPDQVLINRTVMTKFGVKLGELVLVFNKPSSPKSGSAATASPETKTD